MTEVQWFLITLISASGYSAFQLVFGSNAAALHGWRDREDDLLCAQDTSASGQFAQQWQLRMMAQEAALKKVATSKLRRLMARNKAFNCTDIKVGGSVLFYNSPRRKSQPHWRGPAWVLDIDETGAMVKFQTQSFKVARYCVRKQVKANSDGSGSGDHQDDERHLRMNPISPEILGDTWRSLGPMDGSAPDVTHPTQGVIDAESIDSSTKVAPGPRR